MKPASSARRGRSAGRRAVGDPDRLDGHRPRGRGDPGARAGGVLRAPLAAERDGAGVHGPGAGAFQLRGARRRGRPAGARHPRRCHVRGDHHAQAPDAAGHTVHGLLDVGTTPVSAIMRPPTFCDPDEPLRDAARRLGRDGVLRAAGRRSARANSGSSPTPRSEPRSRPTASRSTRRSAISRAPRPVRSRSGSSRSRRRSTCSPPGRSTSPCSTASASAACLPPPTCSVSTRAARSRLRHTILQAADEDELVRTVAQLPKLFLLLMRAGVPSRDLGRVLTPPARRGHRPAGRLLDLAPRSSAPAVGVARPRERRPQRVHALLRSGQRASPTPIPSPDERPRSTRTSSGSAPRSTTASPAAGSVSTTTGSSPASGCGGCRRATGCGRSTNASRRPTSRT